jgi:hypothetical protein
MAFDPLCSHSLGLTRSSVPVENKRLFSGTNAQRAGSGGGVDVTARNSFPGCRIKISSVIQNMKRISHILIILCVK